MLRKVQSYSSHFPPDYQCPADLWVIREFQTQYPGIPVKIYVPAEDQNAKVHLEEWKSRIKELRFKDVAPVLHYDEVPKEKRVRLLHSGVANNTLADLVDKVGSGQKIVVFETNDVPLSPLLSQLHLSAGNVNLKEIPEIQNDCSNHLRHIVGLENAL